MNPAGRHVLHYVAPEQNGQDHAPRHFGQEDISSDLNFVEEPVPAQSDHADLYQGDVNSVLGAHATVSVDKPAWFKDSIFQIHCRTRVRNIF